MNYIDLQYYTSPVGELALGVYDQQLCLADWRYRTQRQQVDARLCQYMNATMRLAQNDLHEYTVQQLNEYFGRERRVFELPLLLAGTDFQQRVWRQLQEIAYGSTCSYLQLARNMGQTAAVRAVAAANGANALSIIVPCHRVVGEGGKLVGYAGGLAAKAALLELERPHLFSKQ